MAKYFYAYRALDPYHTLKKGILFQHSKTKARAILSHQNLTPLSLKKIRLQSYTWQKKIKMQTFFCWHMYYFLRLNLPITEALTHAQYGLKGTFAFSLAAIAQKVQQGVSLSRALRGFQKYFGTFFEVMVVHGEHTGNLAQAFLHLLDYLKWQKNAQEKVRLLMRYPFFLVMGFLTILLFFTFFLIPQFASFFQDMNAPLPTTFHFFLGLKGFIERYAFLLFCVFLMLSALIMGAYQRSNTFKATLHKRLYRWPFKRLGQQIEWVRFCLLMHLLLQAGIHFLPALKIYQENHPNLYLQQLYKRLYKQLTQGHKIANTFQKTGLFSPLFIQLLNTGENVGSLEQMLGETHDFYNQQLKFLINRIIHTLPYVFILLIGGFLALMIYTVFFPLYEQMTSFAL
jgi:type II secretory pathway component PulF